MQVIALLGILIVIGVSVYVGLRDGAFMAVYALLRNLCAFLLAMALFEPLVSVFALQNDPGAQYYRAISFAVVYGMAFGIIRFLKVRFTPANVAAFALVDRIGGSLCGLLNGIVLAGVLLIIWSLMPFAKFLPGDFGRVDPGKLRVGSVSLDAGGGMLRFYDRLSQKIPGGRKFMLDDEPLVTDVNNNGKFDAASEPPEAFQDINKNGRWDRGWLWRYNHSADFQTEDVDRVAPPKPKETK